MGLYINKPLFTKAGLVNEDGSVKVPQTYEELAEFAGIIKEKTVGGYLYLHGRTIQADGISSIPHGLTERNL